MHPCPHDACAGLLRAWCAPLTEHLLPHPHLQHGIKAGERAIDHLTNEETWRRPAFKTIDPLYHEHKAVHTHTVATPASVKKLATKGAGVGKEVRFLSVLCLFSVCLSMYLCRRFVFYLFCLTRMHHMYDIL